MKILLVEDNPGDLRLMSEALRESGFSPELFSVEDGLEALAFLRRQSPFEDAVKPDLMILDLNLPKKNGREVLEEIKQDDELRLIPVIVLTSSDDDSDIFNCYNLHANCYITKPSDLDKFSHIVRIIEIFWFNTATLPK
ncbi:MAG: response regulator [Phycisphaerae bacterium]|nr:response regulator [Phycisphaerae bacterium]